MAKKYKLNENSNFFCSIENMNEIEQKMTPMTKLNLPNQYRITSKKQNPPLFSSGLGTSIGRVENTPFFVCFSRKGGRSNSNGTLHLSIKLQTRHPLSFLASNPK